MSDFAKGGGSLRTSSMWFLHEEIQERGMMCSGNLAYLALLSFGTASNMMPLLMRVWNHCSFVMLPVLRCCGRCVSLFLCFCYVYAREHAG